MSAVATSEISAVEAALRDVAGDSIEEQLARWHRFAGEPKWIELQALKITGDRSSWEASRYAHCDSVSTAARLAATADKWPCPAVYLITNPILDAVASRANAGQWHDMRKGEGTSDAEIAARSVLFVDIDARRPKNTSATASELAHVVRVADTIYSKLAALLDLRSIGYGASGNGRSIFIALDHLDIAAAGRRHREILLCLAAYYTDSSVEIDTSVFDAKRLGPCWGTVKKKGAAGIAERPHRRTSFYCDAEIVRATMNDLDEVVASLRKGLSDAAQREIDKVLGVKAPSSASPSSSSSSPKEGPFSRANAVPIDDVLGWLGLLENGNPVCPGCALTGDSSVAIVGNGLKCSHARCATKGVRAGFRTGVDCVVEHRDVEPRDAVNLMAERFVFEGFLHGPGPSKTRAEQRPAADLWLERVAQCTDEWFTKSPPKRVWLLRDDRTQNSDGTLPQGKVGLLLAEGGIGKTMLLLQLAIAIATATPWLGTLSVPSEGRVLALLGEEDLEESVRRSFRARRSSNARIPEPRSIVVLPLAGLPCSMVETDDRGNPIDAPFLLWLRSFVGTHGPFKSVLVDPLSRFAGADAEIDNASATRFVQALESIATETGATVIVAHHVNKAARGNGAAVTSASSRGSSAITDGVRWVASLSSERVPCEDAETAARLGEIVTFAVTKSNYSKKGEPLLLRRDHDNGGALLPLDESDLEVLRQAREAAAPTARRKSERDTEREAREARQVAERAAKASEREAQVRERDRADDAAAREVIAASPDATVRALVGQLRGILACGSDRAFAAITRVRLAT